LEAKANAIIKIVVSILYHFDVAEWKLQRWLCSLFSLFQTHPEVQDAFLPFQQLAKEDMEQSAILRSHALRVMGTVDKCLTRIRTPEKLQSLMHELGERHNNYNARFEFIDVRSPSQVISYSQPRTNT
jgi:hypothetical protein